MASIGNSIKLDAAGKCCNDASVGPNVLPEQIPPEHFSSDKEEMEEVAFLTAQTGNDNMKADVQKLHPTVDKAPDIGNASLGKHSQVNYNFTNTIRTNKFTCKYVLT